MNILVVCQYYYPEQFRINDICEELANRGHKVTVLTGLPNYPEGNVPKEYRLGRNRYEVINGVEIIRCFEIGRKKGVIGMAINYASYMISVSLKALFLKKDFDIIFSYQLSPVTMVLPAIIMKKRLKKPLLLYCCDIWPESIKNIIKNEESFIYRCTQKISTYIYSKCDYISVTSKPFIDYFNKNHFIPTEKISYIPQHAEDSYFTIESLKDSSDVNFVFMGNIGITQDIDCILNAIEIIKDSSNFKVHFVGSGSYLEESKRIVKEKKIEDKVIFHGRYPLEEMKKFYDLADVCLVTLKSDSLIGLTMPLKLQGYMAAGKMVLGAINGAAQEIINESNCGLCVDSGDYKALASSMKTIIDSDINYGYYGKNGRRYFEKYFTKEKYMETLEKEFNKLLEESTDV